MEFVRALKKVIGVDSGLESDPDVGAGGGQEINQDVANTLHKQVFFNVYDSLELFYSDYPTVRWGRVIAKAC